MKTVPFREFQQKGTKYLDGLPIALTRYGKIVAIVKLPSAESFIQDSIEEPKKPKGYIQSCKHGYPAHLCTKCKKK